MERIDITTTRSTEGGLFFRRELEFPTKTVATPLKTIPAGSVTADDLIDDEFCDIVETHKRVDTSDLEAYRSGSRTNAIVELQRDIEVPNGENIVVVFLEFTDAQEIDPENMRTILDIQDEVADVLTMPLMPSVTDALSPLVESDVRFDRSPWPAYYNSVRHFIECVENYSKPPMGMLPPIGGGRRFEISIDYRDAGVQLFGVDFAGLKATESTCNDDFQDLIADLSRRWGMKR